MIFSHTEYAITKSDQEARAHEARTKEKEKPVEGPGMGAESKPRVQHQRHVFMPDLTQMAVFKPDLRHARQVGSGYV